MLKTGQKRLIIKQLSDRLLRFSNMYVCNRPAMGWIKAIREAIGMSTQQMAKRMGHESRQAITQLERREQDKSITLGALEEAAKAINMRVAYVLLPIDTGNTLEEYVYKRAEEVATKIVKRTATTMKLEDQETSRKRQKKAIKELTEDILREMPRTLWD